MSTASASLAGPAAPIEQEPRATLGPGAATPLIVGSIGRVAAGPGLGGGGIPTMYPRGTRTLGGVEAVIDEDRASAVRAQELSADLLVIATDVDAVYLDWGTPQQRAVVTAHPDAFDPGLFPPGSLGPKVEAAAQFARASGRSAVNGSLDQLSSLLAGDGGTRISVYAEGMETR